MEAHFVHADTAGNLLVVALMFEEGRATMRWAKVWAALPASPGPPPAARTPSRRRP